MSAVLCITLLLACSCCYIVVLALVHCRVFTFLCCHYIVMLSLHCRVVILSYCYIVVLLLYYLVVILLWCYIYIVIMLLYCCCVVILLFCCYIVVLLYCCVVILLWCYLHCYGAVVLSCCYIDVGMYIAYLPRFFSWHIHIWSTMIFFGEHQLHQHWWHIFIYIWIGMLPEWHSNSTLYTGMPGNFGEGELLASPLSLSSKLDWVR